MIFSPPFGVCRLLKGPCRRRASVTACQEVVQLRPVGCSCRSSEKWGTTLRRNTTGRWKWTSYEEQGTVQPVEELSQRPSAPSPARSWSTLKTLLITAWRTAPWVCRAQRAGSAWRRARTWASGRNGAAKGYAESAGWLWRSARLRWCRAVIANSTGVARWSVSSAEKQWPSTFVWKREVRGEGMRAPPDAGRTWDCGRSTKLLPCISPRIHPAYPANVQP